MKNNGQQVGYVRVSSLLQNESRQLEGIDLDIVFTDKISGRDKNRPELTNCLNHLRAGDTLHIHSIDRLARNLRDLESIVSSLIGKGVAVQFHKEGLTFTGDDNPMNVLMLQVMGACAQFELSMIKERQKEGIAIAKKKGKQIGRKAILNKGHIQEIKELWQSGKNKMEISKALGISRVTFYDFLKKYDVELKTQNI
ncbi:Site-specific recombinase [Desulfonema limicola]|uniref:Site-specific recombinase n=1 Tax=Desulfonema limicola TaxID=45656 RepID=A0A975GJV0_9BACT|nr:recombinase family protein [Desulfonema limicola]QTA83907.1 Site-specific recombinase [Desulfonema limicola]